MNTKVTTENYFDCAQGLYWACVQCHDGQGSELYRIQCELDYHPGAMEDGPDEGDAQAVYDELHGLCLAPHLAMLDDRAQAYLDAIQEQYALVHD